MSKQLTPEKGLIFRITHRDNIPWVFEHGLHCRHSNNSDPNFVNIGNTDLIGKRDDHPVPCGPGGTLGDYVPFYFTPFSPMLLNIKTGYGSIQKRTNDEIVILASSLPKLQQNGVQFVFSDSHAYLATARFFTDLADLNQIDWPIIQARDFKRDVNDLGKVARYQAEALVHDCVPLDTLLGVVCYSDSIAESLEEQAGQHGLQLKIVAKPSWYFR